MISRLAGFVCFLSVLSKLYAQQTINYACPSGWENIGTSCYRVFGTSSSQALTWQNAYRTCQGFGSMLVEVHDYLSNEEIGMFGYQRSASKFWIGMSRINANNDAFSTTWNKRTPATIYEGYYHNNMPDLTKGDCMYVERSNDYPTYKWVVGKCKEKMAFICQRPSCPTGSFFCNNGRCINSQWFCDGEDNCGDFSDENSCSSRCRQEFTMSSGTILSPNYPQPYDSAKVCTWTIITPEGTNVFLQFNSFNTEENNDIVDILIGGRTETTSRSIARISGSSPSVSRFRSYNNYMIVRLQSDQQTQYSGFNATFTSLNDNYPEATYLTAISTPQNLEPPLFQSTGSNSYLGNKDYVWVLTAQERRKIITIERLMIDLAMGDEIDIHDGDSPSAPIIARYRAHNNDNMMWTMHTTQSPHGPRFVFSTDYKMYIIMRTASSTSGRGFRFNYWQGCDVTYTQEYGEIFSPGYGVVNYANNQECTWTINIASGKAFSLQFDAGFQLQDNYDFLQVFKAATNSSGVPAHPVTNGFTTVSLASSNPIKSDNGKMFLRFKTGAVTNAKGFRALYSVDCPNPSFSAYTSKSSATSNSYLVNFEVSCLSGYSFRTDEFMSTRVRMECMLGGNWLSANKTRTIPSCLPNYCGLPSTVANAYISASSGVEYNNYATYTCYQGYRLIGNANVTCLASGQWSIGPTCQAASCPQAGDIVNGQRTVKSGDLTSYASIVQYNCNEGFELVGVPILFCQSNGTWTSVLPTCRPLKCPLPMVMQGSLSQNTMPDVGQSVTVSCDTGYQIAGNAVMNCLANETFDAVPMCNDIDECQPLAGCAQRCHNTEGSYTCSCNDGYTLNSDGRNCDDINECNIDNGGCDQVCTNTVGTYTCTCNEAGYILFSQDGTSGYNIQTSVETGLRVNDTLHLNHTCVRVSCPTPVTVADASLMSQRTTHRYQDTISYFCNLGYVRTSGSEDFTCGSDGQWSPSQTSNILVCSGATCPAENWQSQSLVNSPQSVVPNTAVNYLDYVNITCNVQGRGTFVKQRQCLYDKPTNSYKLYGDEYECGVIDCGSPGQEPNTNYPLPAQTTYGNTFTYTCAALMALSGNSSLGNSLVTCMANGNWDFGSLQCLGSSCPDPGYPNGGYQVATSYAKNSIVTFGCNRTGYELTFTEGLECIVNQAGNGLEWNNTNRPQCVDTQNPSVSNCESDRSVIPFSRVALSTPFVGDNTGIKTESYSPVSANTTLTVEKTSVTVTYTVQDFENLADSCTTTFSVTDNVPPTVTCPDSRVEYVSGSGTRDITTVTPANVVASDTTPGGAGTRPTVVVNPPNIVVSTGNIDQFFNVQVQATDSAGLQDTCSFQILIRADPCSEISLPTPANGLKNCSATNNGHVCDLGCLNGFVSYNNPNQDVVTVTCTTGNPWPTVIPACTPLSVQAEYQQVYTVSYSSPTNQILNQACLATYEAQMRIDIPTDEVTAVNTCRPSTGATLVDILQNEVQATFISNSQIDIRFTVKFQPSSSAEGCGNLMETLVSARTLSLMSLTTNNCTEITGSWSNTQNQLQEGSICSSNRKEATIDNVKWCLDCPLGMYSTGSAQCSLCPKGTYKSVVGQQECTPCNPGLSTHDEGSISSNACRSQCSSGTYSKDLATGLPPCFQCAKNSYGFNSTTCQSCDPNTITLNTGSFSSTSCLAQCQPGTFSHNGHVPCTSCPANYIQTQAGQTDCQKCASNNRSTAGSSSCTVINDTAECVGRCQNGAQCVVQDHQVQCLCTAGYYGSQCNIQVDNCLSRPCYNGGVCVNGVNSYTCNCPTGLTGSQCEVDMVNECDSAPCKNGGMCVNQIGSFKCLCIAGFSGITCESQQNICVQQPCSNGARCVSLDNVRRRCECLDGYEGVSCQTNINECSSNPCLYGGSCVDLVNGYRCDCAEGYGGSRCETRVNPCSLGRCQNGQCVDDYTLDNFRCVCNPGYAYGRICQYEITMAMGISGANPFQTPSANNASECRSHCERNTFCAHFTYNATSMLCRLYGTSSSLNPIQETGTDMYTRRCIDPDDDYFTPWYSVDMPNGGDDTERRSDLINLGLNVCNGTRPVAAECRKKGSEMMSSQTGDSFSLACSVDGLVCQHLNNNPCEDYEVRYKCPVADVFEGSTCSQKQYCTDSTCQRGTCNNIFGGFTCTCPLGYSGSKCQHNFDDCTVTPCQNGATCRDGFGQAFCDCLPGFGGPLCQNNLNDCGNCTPGNTLVCNDHINDFTCNCQPGFTGKNCSEDIDECASNPCLHGGSCDNLRNGFRCNCVDGWTGDRCQDIVSQCQVNSCVQDATCQNLFNKFYCNCANNTYGERCENSPNICQDVGPCLNGATCSGSRSEAITCACPNNNYHGDGCETMVDHCAAGDKCKNGGTCTNNVPGFTCSCPNGYTGTTCETNINDCVGVTCPGAGSTCIDMINQRYCRCALGKTGDACNRDVDTNYDMYFYLPQRNGYASLPYPIKLMGSAWSVSMWVRFYESSMTGTFFTMFTTPDPEHWSANSLAGTQKFFSLDNQGLKIFHPTASQRAINHETITVNDGRWHYVVVTWNKNDGFDLILDSVRQGQLRDFTEYMGSDLDLNIWISLGAEYGSNMMIMESRGFRGYLSQLNVYNRQLDFVNEIPLIYDTPRRTFSGLILVWNEFIYHLGVQPIYPSYASKDGCAGNIAGNICNQNQDKAAPVYRSCPSDIYILNRDRLTTVTWPSPVVEGASSEKKRFNSGETFPHGMFINTYEARDASNNAAFCSFTIYVMSDNCTQPDNPYVGTQTCERGNYPHIGCTIGCQDSTRQIDRETPNIYTCGPTGSWYPLQRNRKLRYPACGLTAGPATKRIKITLLYPKVTTANCGGINDTLQIKVREAILTIRNTWSSIICRQPNCTDVIIVINCQTSNTGRRKRQASVTSVDITIPEADATWRRNNPTEELTAEEAITRHVLEEGLFDFSLVIPNAELDPNGFELESTSICPEPQTALNGYCVFCGAGNFYNSVTKICEDCAIGSYQSLDNQTSCVSCDPGKTTETTGTFTSAGCKTSCPVGSYFDNTLNRCELCAVGYYQSMTGQFYCDPCPAGKTTRDPGSNSSAACNDDCPSGQELTPTGSCQPCPVGTYRTQGAQTVCESCPSNLTTPSTGSKTINNCSLISCLAGNYRSGDSPGTCVPCPIGTYQDQKWQTSCNNCSSSQPDRYRTDQTGSVSVNQCKFFCPSGYGDIGNSCEICAIGFYKNNTRNYYGPCVPCPGNRRTPSRGSTSESECTIYRCPPGYKPNATSDGCDPCPYGTYQSLPDQENCLSCNGGFSTREIAATTSSQCQKFCEDGQEVDSFGTCINCTVGYYKTNTDFKFNNCTMCPTNYVTPSIKSISVNNCTVRACLAGSRRNGDDSGCIGCERGTYQEMPYKQTCSSCGNQQSTRQANSTQASDCEAYCLSGEEKASGGQCTVCPVGYFKDNNVDVFSMCTVCPDARFITANNGSTSQSDCTVANCSAGYYRDTNTNTCKVCAKGTYQPDKWQTSCVQCPTDKTTSGTGATDSADCQLECPPGKEDINGTCEPCPKGYYKVQAAAARCDECPVNTTTSGTGSIQQSDCSVAGCHPGYFLNASLNNCFRCPYDTYQPMKWQTTCDSCQNNYVTLYTGSVANSDCVVECSSGSEYDTVTGTCKLCQRGYYRNQAMRTEITCQLCPLDKITPGTGGTSSSDCSQANCTQPGYYRNPITNTCTLCPDGTYNSDKWQDSCASCGSGFTTNGTGKMVQSDCIRDCPSGSFPDGSNTCRNCARGFYRDRGDGLFPCRPCPSGYTTVGEGATSSANCSITACGIGERFVNGACVPCQRNYYQNLANQRDCIPCGFGKYTDNEGSTSIAQCKTFCVDTNICHTNAACTATADNMTCTCNTDWRGDGYNCTHLCDLGYCVRGSCRKSPLSCSCPEGYTGDRCEAAVDRSAQSSRLNETIVIASVSAAAFLMLIIIIIVCCVAMARRSKKAKPPMAYNDMGPIIEKPVFAPTGYSLYDNRSMRSMSPSRVGTMNRHGMSQVPELTFDNQAYQDDPAIYTA